MKWRRFTVIVKSSTTIVDKCVSTCDRARAKNTKKLNKYREEKFKVASESVLCLHKSLEREEEGWSWSDRCCVSRWILKFNLFENSTCEMWVREERMRLQVGPTRVVQVFSTQIEHVCSAIYIYRQYYSYRVAIALPCLSHSYRNMTSRVRKKLCIHKTFFNKLKFCLFVDRDDLVY